MYIPTRGLTNVGRKTRDGRYIVECVYIVGIEGYEILYVYTLYIIIVEMVGVGG